MRETNQISIQFLQWALPKLGYCWKGFRKPRGQILKRIQERIAELELSGFAEYKAYLISNPEEWTALDKRLYITISRFYRDRKLWEILSEKIIPELVTNQELPVKVWSAGCCNGEEPYSIAIAANENGFLPDISILATDRNSEVLERANAGAYPQSSVKELSENYKSRYFELNSEKSEYLINQIIKDAVTFEQRDISVSLPDKKFELIFCRYLVFTYFSESFQREFLNRIQSRLSDGGYLITGSNEKIPETKWLEMKIKPYGHRKISGSLVSTDL